MNEYIEQIIKDSVTDEKLRISKERRKMIHKMLNYYEGSMETHEYIKDKFNIKAFQEIPCSNFNITRRFIDRMSRIYTQGAKRNVNDQYDKLTWSKNAKMKHLEKMTRLLGTIAVQVNLKEKHNMPYFDYIPFYSFDVHFGDDDPFNPISLTYPIMQNIADIDYGSVEDLKYAYWDDQVQIIYDEKGNILDQNDHNLGFLPFVFFHREHQLDNFFVTGAEDIMQTNELINILLTEMNLGMRFQMFGQPVISGLYDDEKITRAGSDETIVLPEGANFDFVTSKGNVKDAIDLLKSMLDLVAQNNHLYVQFAQDGGETPSGVALKIKDLSRYEDYLDDVELFRIYEYNLYYMEREIAKRAGISLPEELQLDFYEPEYPTSAVDQIALEQHELATNQTTQWKLLMRHNKDINEDQARSIVDDNKKDNNVGTERQSIFGQVGQGLTEAEQG